MNTRWLHLICERLVRRSSAEFNIPLVAGFSVLTTLASFVQIATFSRLFGISQQTDAYFVAFFAVNTLVLIIASGSLSSAVPLVIVRNQNPHHSLESQGRIGSILIVSGVILATITIIFWLTSYKLANILAPGFSNELLELTSILLRILSPTIFLTGLSLVMSSILQFYGSFWPIGATNLIAILPSIIIMLIGHRLEFYVDVIVVATSLTFGSLVQCILLAFLINGMSGVPGTTLLSQITVQLLRRIIPIMSHHSLAYSALIIERIISSSLAPGSISGLSYAYRLIGLFITIVITPISTVFFPRYTKLADASSEGMALRYLIRWSRVAILMGGLASAVYSSAGYHLIAVVYGHGSFDADATRATYHILTLYGFAAPAIGGAAILQVASYSSGAIWLPAIVSAVDILIYILLAEMLSRSYGVIGLVLARVVSFWFVIGLLVFLGQRRFGHLLRPLFTSLAGSVLASFVAAVITTRVGLISTISPLPQVVGLILLAFVGATLYILLMSAFVFALNRLGRSHSGFTAVFSKGD